MDFRDPGSEGRSAVHFRDPGSEGRSVVRFTSPGFGAGELTGQSAVEGHPYQWTTRPTKFSISCPCQGEPRTLFGAPPHFLLEL